MNDLTHDMIARGDVVIQTTEGTRMTTEKLRFKNKEQRIDTDAFVRVDRRGDVLTGLWVRERSRIEGLPVQASGQGHRADAVRRRGRAARRDQVTQAPMPAIVADAPIPVVRGEGLVAEGSSATTASGGW